MAGWTLPYQMGVKVAAADSPLEVAMTGWRRWRRRAAKVDAAAGSYLISPKTTTASSR